MTNIVIVDSQEIFRDGIKYHMSTRSNFNILGEASDVGKAIELIDFFQPDIAVLDLFLNEDGGMNLLKHYRENPTKTKIVVLSIYEDTVYLDRCLEYNVQAFVSKSDSGKELIEAIEQAVAGEFYLSQKVSDQMVNRLLKRKVTQKVSHEIKVTQREVEILNLIKAGLSNAEIADKLSISHRTVETHRSNLFKKLIVKNSIELINKAKHLSIID